MIQLRKVSFYILLIVLATTAFFEWEDPGILPEVIYMLAVGVIVFLILVAREYGIVNELMHKFQKNQK